MSDNDELLTKFLQLRQTLMADCEHSGLPRFIASAVLQSLAFELQAQVLGRDRAARSPPSG